MKKITLLTLLISLTFFSFTSAQVILSEGFEGNSFPPSGWSVYRGTNDLGPNNDWVLSTDAYSGSGAAFNQFETVASGQTAEDWLVTSQIDLTNSTNSELLFYTKQTYASDWASIYEVRVSTTSQTDHNSFSTVASYNETTLNATYNVYELKTLDLSAYDGMMIYIAFVHINNYGDDWYIDDMQVRSPLGLDAQASAINLNRYSLTSTDNQLSVDVYNNGSSAITSLDISWGDGTNNYSESFSVNIPAGQTVAVTHSTPVNYASVDEKNITVTIGNVNGVSDGDSSNNTASKMFNTLSQLGTKRVVVEEATGTWCGWCPRGTVGLNYVTSTYSDVIGIAVHNSDPMEVNEYDSAVSAQIGGYPSSIVDRSLINVDPNSSSLENARAQLINNIVPVDMSSSAASTSGSTVDITASATFFSNFSAANYRLAVIITEDGVTGTTSGYAQANYYSGGGNGAMGGYENLPNPVPAAQMVYDHVGVALLGGFNGLANSVPAVINNGQTVSETFTYTIPATSNQANMHVIALLLDGSTGEVVSGYEQTMTQALSTEEFNVLNGIKIYPNPANNELNISFADSDGDYNISVTDILGRTVINTEQNNLFGAQNINLPLDNLKSGNYILRVSNNNNSFVTKFIKK